MIQGITDSLDRLDQTVNEKIGAVNDRIDQYEMSQQKGAFTTVNKNYQLVNEFKKAGFEEFLKGKQKDISFEVKAQFTTGSGSSLSTIENVRDIKDTPKTGVRIFDILPQYPMSEGVVRFVQETAYTDNATYTAEANAYSESSGTLAEVEVTPAKVSSYINFTREFSSDVAGSIDYVNRSLSSSISQKMDNYIWNGTSGANGFDGLASSATDASASVDTTGSEFYGIFSADSSGDVNLYDVIYSVSGYLTNRYFNPNIALVNPKDFITMVLGKGTDAQYVQRNLPVVDSINGVRIVVSPTVSQGKYLLLDSDCVGVFIRDNMRFEISDSHASNFISDIAVAKLSTRGALAVFKPTGLIYGDISTTALALAGL